MKNHRLPRRVWATNANTSEFASKIPTLTEPTNDGVVHLTRHTGLVPCRLKVWFIGLGADNDAFSARFIAWDRHGTATPFLWVPTIICELGAIVGAAVGVAGSPVLATERFADTLTIVTEPTITADTTRQGTIEVSSPANDLIAHAIIPFWPCDKFEVAFDQTTNTPTMNCLYQFI